MVGFYMMLYPDGSMVLRGGKRDRWSRLNATELRQLQDFLSSAIFAAAVDALSDLGYEVGCCDVSEVTLEFHGKILGYDVCDGPPVSPEVAQVVEYFNRLMKIKFDYKERLSLPLGQAIPVGSCRRPG